MGTAFWSDPANSPTSEHFSAVSLGANHGCAITTNGGVMCWGVPQGGRLGIGSYSVSTNYYPPTQVKGLESGVMDVAAGGTHSCALLTTGGVKCWGEDSHGQLGDGKNSDQLEPVDVHELSSGVTAISANYGHTCAALESGGVKCWGYNEFGMLGNGTKEESNIPVDVPGISDKVTFLSAGLAHTCAATEKGVLCWGNNQDGQLGTVNRVDHLTPIMVPNIPGTIRSLSAGYLHTCIVKQDGVAFCWGQNDRGQIGDGTSNAYRLAAAQVQGIESRIASITGGANHTCAVTEEGKAYCWGDNEKEELHILPYKVKPSDVININYKALSVTGGENHSCALLQGGKVMCWGADGPTGHYKTGIPTVIDNLVVKTVVAGANHNCGLTAGGGVKCWGDSNLLGNIKYNGMPKPLDVVGLESGVKAIALGSKHSCALTNAGAVKCWGMNELGQLGNGTQTKEEPSDPTDVVGLNGGVAAIAVGAYHTCVLMENGGVKCWGQNSNGQLGNDSTDDQSKPVDVVGLDGGIAALFAGGSLSCVLMDDGGLKCWGLHRDGSGGRPSSSPVPVDIEIPDGVQMITAGSDHVCILTTVGGVKCLGKNTYGQLGIGSTASKAGFVGVFSFESGAISIAAGTNHTCALMEDGSVKCWGYNTYSQLGDGLWADLHWGYCSKPILQVQLTGFD